MAIVARVFSTFCGYASAHCWLPGESAKGHMTFTVIPCRPHSRAATRLRALMPSLAMAYAVWPAWPTTPAVDPRLTTLPPCFFRWGKQACMKYSVPSTPEPKARETSSSLVASREMPTRDWAALFTSMSTVPKALTASATTAWTSSRWVTSQASGMAAPPADLISAAVLSHFESVLPTTTTLAPSLARARAMPRPTPWPAPVTIATFPSSFPTGSLSF